MVAYHKKLLDNFLKAFWDYYRELLAYREAPSSQAAEKLRAKFDQLFDSETGYQQLDERKRLTAAKISELLLVLEHPELPLHNNPAELDARTIVQRRLMKVPRNLHQLWVIEARSRGTTLSAVIVDYLMKELGNVKK